VSQRVDETFLIDGYNLLRRAFTFLDGRDLPAARAQLEVRLREFQRTRGPGIRILIVFDGSHGIFEQPPRESRDPGFQIIYSNPPETADDVILRECRRRPGTVTVVTSDRKDIGNRIPGRWITSEEFAEILDEAMRRPGRAGTGGARRPPLPEKPSPQEVSPEEVEEWKRIFSRPKPGSRKRAQNGREPRRE
jgi:predicted RNA-binding protein with PIN domain